MTDALFLLGLLALAGITAARAGLRWRGRR